MGENLFGAPIFLLARESFYTTKAFTSESWKENVSRDRETTDEGVRNSALLKTDIQMDSWRCIQPCQAFSQKLKILLHEDFSFKQISLKLPFIGNSLQHDK